MIQYALAVGEGSRLKRALVYDKQLAVDVGVDWSWRIDPGMFAFHLELKPDADVRGRRGGSLRRAGEGGAGGPQPRELEKAKNNLRAHLLRELATNSGRAHALGTYEPFLGELARGLQLCPSATGASRRDRCRPPPAK